MTLADKIKQYRKSNGLSMNKLAQLCNVHTSMILRLEKGKGVTLKSIKKISAAIGITEGQLISQSCDKTTRTNEEDVFIELWRKLKIDQKRLLSDLAKEFTTRYISK